jgi:hypothetical protein
MHAWKGKKKKKKKSKETIFSLSLSLHFLFFSLTLTAHLKAVNIDARDRRMRLALFVANPSVGFQKKKSETCELLLFIISIFQIFFGLMDSPVHLAVVFFPVMFRGPAPRSACGTHWGRATTGAGGSPRCRGRRRTGPTATARPFFVGSPNT